MVTKFRKKDLWFTTAVREQPAPTGSCSTKSKTLKKASQANLLIHISTFGHQKKKKTFLNLFLIILDLKCKDAVI